jgi:hypothetical protein
MEDNKSHDKERIELDLSHEYLYLVDQIRYIYLENCRAFHKLSMESKIIKIGASSKKL